MKTAVYPITGGGTFTVEYDPDAPCRICGEPVVYASVGGVDVCQWCDMGIWRDGRCWTFRESVEMLGVKL